MGYIETLRQLPDMVSPGVSACPGCGGELVLRRVLQLAGENTIVCVPPDVWLAAARSDGATIQA